MGFHKKLQDNFFSRNQSTRDIYDKTIWAIENEFMWEFLQESLKDFLMEIMEELLEKIGEKTIEEMFCWNFQIFQIEKEPLDIPQEVGRNPWKENLKDSLRQFLKKTPVEFL